MALHCKTDHAIDEGESEVSTEILFFIKEWEGRLGSAVLQRGISLIESFPASTLRPVAQLAATLLVCRSSLRVSDLQAAQLKTLLRTEVKRKRKTLKTDKDSSVVQTDSPATNEFKSRLCSGRRSLLQKVSSSLLSRLLVTESTERPLDPQFFGAVCGALRVQAEKLEGACLPFFFSYLRQKRSVSWRET